MKPQLSGPTNWFFYSDTCWTEQVKLIFSPTGNKRRRLFLCGILFHYYILNTRNSRAWPNQQDSIFTWKEIKKKLGLSHLISKNTNPEFPQGSKNPMFLMARSEGLKTVGQLFHWEEKRWLAPSEIKEKKWSIPDSHNLSVVLFLSVKA